MEIPTREEQSSFSVRNAGWESGLRVQARNSDRQSASLCTRDHMSELSLFRLSLHLLRPHHARMPRVCARVHHLHTAKRKRRGQAL